MAGNVNGGQGRVNVRGVIDVVETGDGYVAGNVKPIVAASGHGPESQHVAGEENGRGQLLALEALYEPLHDHAAVGQRGRGFHDMAAGNGDVMSLHAADVALKTLADALDLGLHGPDEGDAAMAKTNQILGHHVGRPLIVEAHEVVIGVRIDVPKENGRNAPLDELVDVGHVLGHAADEENPRKRVLAGPEQLSALERGVEARVVDDDGVPLGLDHLLKGKNGLRQFGRFQRRHEHPQNRGSALGEIGGQGVVNIAVFFDGRKDLLPGVGLDQLGVLNDPGNRGRGNVGQLGDIGYGQFAHFCQPACLNMFGAAKPPPLQFQLAVKTSFL